MRPHREISIHNDVRPVVPVYVEGLDRVAQSCLLDSGSLPNRFGRWVADAAGIDLGDAARGRIAVGGLPTVETHVVRVQLRIGDVTWEASVAFCEPWPFGFQLLGQEGFFRWFKAVVRHAINPRSPDAKRVRTRGSR